MRYKIIAFLIIFSLLIPQVSVFAQGEKISLDIKGMDIIDVLKLLSKQADLNIVAGTNVRGRVTLFLKDVDPWDAFEIILAANNLAYEKKGDIITVMSERDYELLYGEKFNVRRKVKIIKLRYASVTEVGKALNQIKTKVGTIIIDEGSNSVIIKDAPEAMEEMAETVKELDISTETKVYSLNYANAEKLKEKLTPMLSKLGSIEIDERTNKVVVNDLPEKVKELDKLVEAFDEKTKQVLIEAKIIQIDLNDEYKFGVNWDTFFNGLEHLKLGAAFPDFSGTGVTAPALPTSGGGTGGIFRIGDLGKDNYQTTIKAMEKLGRTNILSSPRITTANNEEAKILVGINQPYATSTTTTPSTGSSITSYQITYLDLGVKLVVTPTINEDKFITMKIKPEVTSKTSDYEYGSPATDVPVVKTSEVETTVMVKDGTTIVIAGLIETRDEEEVNKVPLLGDIPLIGRLFQSRTKGSVDNSEKTELVIFITPSIVTGDVPSEEKELYREFIRDLEMTQTDREFFKISFKREEPLVKQGEGVFPIYKEAKEAREIKKIEEIEGPEKMEPSNTYKEFVKNKVFKVISEYLTPSLRTLRGDVNVEFTVLQDGTLKEEPRVLESASEMLEKLTVVGIRKAAPFPPFPQGVGLEEKTFQVLISY